jgi:hypothetical protein
LPPERPAFALVLLLIVDIVLAMSGVCFFLLVGLGALHLFGAFSPSLPDYYSLIYLSPGFLFVSMAIDRILRHRYKVYAAQLEDRSEVERFFLHKILKEEESASVVSYYEKLGPEGWTVYQVLPLRQLVIQKADAADIIPMARTILDVLKDYSADTAYDYDEDLYKDWKTRIDDAITAYQADGAGDKEEHELRSVISEATDHVTYYDMIVAEGSVMIRSLLTVVAVGSIVMLYYGILPMTYSEQKFGIINWSILGAAGALMAALQNLRNSDVTEVGNTEGRKEIWRTVSGGTLGLMAGALAYGLIVGGIMTSPLLPTLPPVTPADMGKAMIWAISAGVLVDIIINKVMSPLRYAKVDDNKGKKQ